MSFVEDMSSICYGKARVKVLRMGGVGMMKGRTVIATGIPSPSECRTGMSGPKQVDTMSTRHATARILSCSFVE